MLDYAAQELRAASILAGDEDMMKSFLAGADVHSETASMTFGIPIEDVSKDLRTAAKAVS